MAYGTLNIDNLTSSDGGVISPNINSLRNRIINGAMVIDQRNAGASVTCSDGTFLVDRFVYDSTQASKFTAQQNAGSVTPPAGFTKYLGFTSSSAYSITASDYFLFEQRIEGFNVGDLGWGAAGASTVTLSFWVRSSLTGTFGGSVFGGQYYPFSYTISSANTWEQKTITIVGSTSGSWGTGTSTGMRVAWSLGTGSTNSGTAGSWTNTTYFSATGATSVVGTNGATFYLTGVQLEKGSTATSFDYRPYGTELALCQRYYIKISNGGSGNGYPNFANPTAYSTGGSSYRFQIALPVQMRTYPSFSQTGSLVILGQDGGTATGVGLADGGGNPIVGMGMTNSATTVGLSNILRGNNDTTAALNFSAEL